MMVIQMHNSWCTFMRRKLHLTTKNGRTFTSSVESCLR